jgi:hypothetical protein
VVGVSPEPIEVNAPNSSFWRALGRGKSDTAIDNKDVLSFSVLENIRPMSSRFRSRKQPKHTRE